MQARRRVVVGLAGVGASLFAASWWFPYWNFRLVAPQYPKGLNFQITLHGIIGDVAEIDILNHYIGMHPLSQGALLEAAMSPYIVGAVVLGVIAGLVFAGKRLGALALIPALGLPIGFLVDTLYWMWKFGHDLDPEAPLSFRPFMPQLFGAGSIGQFHTVAWPGAGFWMALGGALAVSIAVWLRRSVCDACPKGGTCGVHCSQFLSPLPPPAPTSRTPHAPAEHA